MDPHLASSPSPSCDGAPLCCRPTPAAPGRSAPAVRSSLGPTSSLRAAASSGGPARCCGSRPEDAGAPHAPDSRPTRGLWSVLLHLPALLLGPYFAPPPPTGQRAKTQGCWVDYSTAYVERNHEEKDY